MRKKVVVLVVEDETLIRMNAVQMLENADFATVAACNADDAMKVLELRNDIRAVFTDINMPGSLDGMRLARIVRNRWPPIHLIVTSGLMLPSVEDLSGVGKFIPKPYQMEDVIITLRGLLDRDSPVDPGIRAA
jgi:DNA-binding NtrC family response regulator